jgi:putative PIN family toxin of toxin-antitoxin system
MKVVLDTNVLVSALYRGGKPLRAVLYCFDEPTVEVQLSEEIFTEYHLVLNRPKFRFSKEFLTQWLQRIEKEATMTDNIPPLDFHRDRKDAKFLALARALSADYLITGDADFTDVPANLLPHTRIVSASEFCAIMNL